MEFNVCIKCGTHKGNVTTIQMSKTGVAKKITRTLCEKCITEIKAQGWTVEAI